MTQSILDHPLVSERYFFPRREQFKDPFWVDCGDVQLSCYYQQKYPDAKTIVFFHGNGEIVPDYLELFVPVFDQMGYNLFLAEYRGYSMSTGVPAMVAMLGDVEHIIKAGHFLFNDLRDAVFNGLCRSSRIKRGDGDGRWRDGGILRNRQVINRKTPRDHQDDGDDPGENRTL